MPFTGRQENFFLGGGTEEEIDSLYRPYSVSKSKMKSRRQVRSDAGVFFIRLGADDEANADSALI